MRTMFIVDVLGKDDAGCETIGVLRMVVMSGAAGRASLEVRVVDPRDGSVYAGAVPREANGTGPVTQLPCGALATCGPEGVTVNLVWPQKTP